MLHKYINRILLLLFLTTLVLIITSQQLDIDLLYAQNLPGCWPQGYSAVRDDQSGTLTLSTRYYTIVHDLKKGGTISKISHTHGRVDNLLKLPIQTQIQTEKDIKNQIRSSRVILQYVLVKNIGN